MNNTMERLLVWLLIIAIGIWILTPFAKTISSTLNQNSCHVGGRITTLQGPNDSVVIVGFQENQRMCVFNLATGQWEAYVPTSPRSELPSMRATTSTN